MSWRHSPEVRLSPSVLLSDECVLVSSLLKYTKQITKGLLVIIIVIHNPFSFELHSFIQSFSLVPVRTRTLPVLMSRLHLVSENSRMSVVVRYFEDVKLCSCPAGRTESLLLICSHSLIILIFCSGLHRGKSLILLLMI